MGWSGDDMELIWAIILPNTLQKKLRPSVIWESYGKTIPIAFPRLWYVDYKISPMDWFDMEYQLHKLPIVADKNLASAP